MVTPDYFRSLGTRLIAGRTFHGPSEEHVVIIDQKMAEAAWPGENPIGNSVRTAVELDDEAEWSTVIGVVEHMRHVDVTQDGRETVFFPLYKWAYPGFQMHVTVRTSAEPGSVVAPARELLRSVDSQVPLARVRTMRSLVDTSFATVRFALVLLSIFAVCAIALAAVGLFGVVTSAVGRRTKEIGIRSALGAPRRKILQLVVGQELLLAAFGILLGTFGAMALTRMLTNMLYGVTPLDPQTFVAAGVLVMAAATAAIAIPARRAVRVDPTIALSAGSE